MLRTSTALVTGLAGLAVSVPAPAQSVVTATDDVVPFPGANPQSSWDLGGSDLYVGDTGTGWLTIEGGGTVSNKIGYIGDDSGSSGAVTVVGPGSTWTNSSFLHVGYSGSGTLSVEAGGTVSSINANIGATSASIGAVAVAGARSTWTNSGTLSVGYLGTGTLSIEDGGTVSNTIGYLGYDPGSRGAVTVTGPGSTWANSGLSVGYSSAGVLDIADGGTVSVDNGAGIARIATLGGSTGTLNIGSAAGQTAVAAGTLDAARVQFGAGTGLLNFNHINTDYVFDAAITGAGTIGHHAGTTILTGDSTGFTGATTVSGGTLLVNGVLGGTLDVLNGATLGGSGTVGTIVAGPGVTIAPGNSIGTLNVAGDITFNPGSRYDVEVDPTGTGSDRIHATGQAFLNGGSVVHVGMGGIYDPSSTYTILTADGGLIGAFDDVTSDFAFLDATLGYGANDVTLTLDRNDVDFMDVGQTRNQRVTAKGVEHLVLGHDVYDAVVGLDATTARRAFDGLSGEIHASAKTALIEDSRFVRDATTNRVRAAFEDGGTAAGPDHGPAVWGHAFGSWGETDGDGNAANLDRNTSGFLTGFDAPVAQGWRLGMLTGYSRSSFDADARTSSGTADNYHLGLYGGTQWGALGLRAGAAYSWHTIETSRSVGFTGFADSLEAGYDAGTAQVFGEVGYAIQAGGFALEPFAGLAYVNLDIDGFAERGGAAALTGNEGSTDATVSTLGVRVGNEFAIGDMTATARGLVGWRHAFGGLTPTSSHAFAGGDVFAAAGVPIAQDAAVVEAGLDLNLARNATLGFSYGGQFGSGAQDHSARATFSLKF